MQKVVLDTNILVSALWSPNGNPFKVLEKVLNNELNLYFTNEIYEEYEEVLYREKLAFPHDKVAKVLDEISEKGVLVEVNKSAIDFADESDRKFYDTAKANNAIVITGNLKHYPENKDIMLATDFLVHINEVINVR